MSNGRPASCFLELGEQCVDVSTHAELCLDEKRMPTGLLNRLKRLIGGTLVAAIVDRESIGNPAPHLQSLRWGDRSEHC
jgi:hypothetical protein